MNIRGIEFLLVSLLVMAVLGFYLMVVIATEVINYSNETPPLIIFSHESSDVRKMMKDCAVTEILESEVDERLMFTVVCSNGLKD